MAQYEADYIITAIRGEGYDLESVARETAAEGHQGQVIRKLAQRYRDCKIGVCFFAYDGNRDPKVGEYYFTNEWDNEIERIQKGELD